MMRSPRIGSGRISQRCVLRVSTVAKYSPNAFPGTYPWQDFRLMYAKRGLGRKNTPSVAAYRRYVSKISWFWQDLRAAYPKSPANRCLGIHIVKILPGRAPFPVRGLQIMHSKLILPSRFPNQRKIGLIGQKVCPEQLFTPLRTGTLSCDAIRPRQAPLPISAERRPRLP